MIVTVTAENPDGEMKHLSVDAPTYVESLAQAEAQIPMTMGLGLDYP